MQFTKVILIFLPTLLYTSCNKLQTNPDADPFLQPAYWNHQALKDILPYWTDHLIDSVNGSFYSTLDVSWQPVNDTVRFPSMIARHLFSYSVGYLMSGDEHYIVMARKLKDYLLQNAWDNKFGGWYDALSPNGTVLRSSKSTFVQLYVITGLTLYYFVTHDQDVRNYIDQSNDLLEEKVWDHENGGYFDNLTQDWSLVNEVKTISSQLAPSSGYLLYLYLVTRDKKYLEQSERIMDIITRKMADPNTGWILEAFDKDLNYQERIADETEINIGHNIEVAWTLSRLYLINQRKDYLIQSKTLADRIHRYGFNTNHGVWYATIGNQRPETHSDYTHWWVQAYGQMFDLCLARLYPDQDYVNAFRQGAHFWDSFFMDKGRGDSYLSVTEKGAVKDDRKANQFKSSYHNIELALLNSLYLSCWINRQPMTLYFKITRSKEGEILYPLPIEELDAKVDEVLINGQPYSINTSANGFVKLPALVESKIAVTWNNN